MSGVIGFCIIIFFIYQAMRKPQVVADSARPPATSKSFCIWVVFVGFDFFMFSTVANNLFSGLFLFLGGFVFLVGLLLRFPRLFAYISIYFGWVKISYFFGGIAYQAHYKDKLAGALFLGWCAQHQCGVDKKELSQQWLEARLAKHTDTFGSGAMLVHTLMKFESLGYPAQRAQFKLLQGLNKNTIPPNIARSVFRFILARSCIARDWSEIRAQARHWQLVGRNRFAQWVDMYHWSLGAEKIPFWMGVKIAYLYWVAGNAALKKYLPQLKPVAACDAPETLSFAQLKQLEFTLYAGAKTNSLKTTDAWTIYRTTGAAQAAIEWMPRIKALGCFNADEVFARLGESISDVASMGGSAADLNNEAAVQERENQFKLVEIKIAAMVKRTEQNTLMTGVQEYEEFLALVRAAERLGKDNQARAQVFFKMRTPCWNWIAGLWNAKKDRPLACLASNYLAPLAQEHGDTEAFDFFSGIARDRFI